MKEKDGIRIPVNISALVLENGRKLNDIELLVNKILAAQVILEDDVKKLEEGLSGYLNGMSQALTAAREFRKNEVCWTPTVINELNLFDDMARLHESIWRNLDRLHTAIMVKFLKADISFNETWSKEMS